MLVRRRPRALVLVAMMAGLAIESAPRRVLAQEPVAPSSAEARRHFENGRALYGHGAYREALGELQAAHALDPSAKDLVFNLGVVEEKLGDIDEALHWFHAYTTMTLTPQERERADAYVRRLEGARQELDHPQAPAEAGAPTAVAPTDADLSAPPPPPARGRIDAATIATGSVAGAALVFGVVLGVKATGDRPTHFVTGVDGSYPDLVDRVHTAHDEAVAADIGFGVAAAAGIAATVLYLTRTRQSAAPASGKGQASTLVSAGPLVGGGAIFLRGSF